ncbi:hypothetical protein [Alteromonas macleodii]|uniref:Membrane protein n=1 Tax=Alteromonas macleodii TaxID=28108 RepID=A0AB36FLH6_ALTMA|nr:hypothetical protein [Alteromonas macleodii]OES23734.1 putative membrane protein [Alteromonas macleodii]OES23947.1 putative membrane protein [Alteromonas macleodii]OES25647.1 putative membrane protein [Alteromonas macleodii]OES38941.1 putative membrane protein [Alteromonas macleodii]
MENEFGLLPWVLLALIAFLLGHSFTGKLWKTLSRIGLVSIFLALAISTQFTVENIKGDTVLFISQVALFLTFIGSSIVVGIREIVSVFSKSTA